MTAAKPLPPTFAIGDRVTILDSEKRPRAVDTIGKVLKGGARVRLMDHVEAIRRKAVVGGGHYWECLGVTMQGFGFTLRAYADGDDREVKLAGLRADGKKASDAAKTLSAAAAAVDVICGNYAEIANDYRARAATNATESERLSAEIAALEAEVTR